MEDKINDFRAIDLKQIDAYYDLFDEACMLLYEELKLNYFDCIIRIYDDLNEGVVNSKGLNDDVVTKLRDLEDKISDFYALNEEIREALRLIIIKGLEHKKISLNYIEPDIIGLIYSYFIKRIFDNKLNNISVLDITMGIGNNLNVIQNNLSFDVNLIGIENDPNISKIARMYSDLEGNNITIYDESFLNYPSQVDVIIGNLTILDDPHSALLKAQNTGRIMFYLVDNRFFEKDNMQSFKENFTGTMLGLIVLSSDLMKEDLGYSILILSPRHFKDYQTMISTLPSIKDENKFQSSLKNVGDWLKKVII